MAPNLRLCSRRKEPDWRLRDKRTPNERGEKEKEKSCERKSRASEESRGFGEGDVSEITNYTHIPDPASQREQEQRVASSQPGQISGTRAGLLIQRAESREQRKQTNEPSKSPKTRRLVYMMIQPTPLPLHSFPIKSEILDKDLWPRYVCLLADSLAPRGRNCEMRLARSSQLETKARLQFRELELEI